MDIRFHENKSPSTMLTIIFNVELRNFVTTEYPTEYYDRLYSIGAWQHVRPKEIAPLVTKFHRTLKPGGRMLHHFFCRPTDRLFASIACSQLFFPACSALHSDFIRARSNRPAFVPR